jgi:hypothetical protein
VEEGKTPQPTSLSGGQWVPRTAKINPSAIIMHLLLLLPVAAAGYSLIYLLLGGGFGGAVVVYIVAKLLGK